MVALKMRDYASHKQEAKKSNSQERKEGESRNVGCDRAERERRGPQRIASAVAGFRGDLCETRRACAGPGLARNQARLRPRDLDATRRTRLARYPDSGGA